ncbi:MAG: polysaccharide biosynthesis protein [Desulfuromonadales bacterium C00003107]|jgi:O-antigen/teichoic acid export membrane protein|nr:MAG: polysaccharide biosynthesis protein [Desulfuromonadales bacterium C00003107]
MFKTFSQKLNNLISDNRFSEILTGSAFSLAARLGGMVFAMLVSILVARVYGSEMVGVLAIVQAFMMMASIFAVMGTNVSILRLIPEHIAKHSISSAFRVYQKIHYSVALVSVLLGGVLFFFADLIAVEVFSKPFISSYIAITALCVIFRALMDLNTQTIRGLRLIRTFAFMQILPHAGMLLVMLVMMKLSRQASVPVYAQLAAWGMTALIGAVIVSRGFRQRMDPGDVVESMSIRELIVLSAPMLMTAYMNFIIGQIGVLILGIYRPASEVGYYAVAVKLATLTSFVLLAINSMVAPKFSELFYTGRLDELFYIARKSTKLIFWTTFPILLLLAVLGRPVLSLFGKSFVAAYFPMLILVIGQFINSVSGSTGYFMNMTGHQRSFSIIIFSSSALNLILNILLIPKFGLYGAALAGMIGLALWNIWTLLFIKRKFGRSIGYLPFVSL